MKYIYKNSRNLIASFIRDDKHIPKSLRKVLLNDLLATEPNGEVPKFKGMKDWNKMADKINGLSEPKKPCYLCESMPCVCEEECKHKYDFYTNICDYCHKQKPNTFTGFTPPKPEIQPIEELKDVEGATLIVDSKMIHPYTTAKGGNQIVEKINELIRHYNLERKI